MQNSMQMHTCVVYFIILHAFSSKISQEHVKSRNSVLECNVQINRYVFIVLRSSFTVFLRTLAGLLFKYLFIPAIVIFLTAFDYLLE